MIHSGFQNHQYKKGLEKYRTKEWLYQKYWIEELSLTKIARIVNVSTGCIKKWMDKVQISRRKDGARIGQHNHNFKGFTVNSQGYRLIYSPQHPNRDNRNYVREHILVVEKHLGRYLKAKTIVHHINDNRLDNRLENLYLFPTSNKHNQYHQQKRKHSSKFIPITQSNLSMND